jgi:hypothetical protein
VYGGGFWLSGYRQWRVPGLKIQQQKDLSTLAGYVASHSLFHFST